MHDEKRKKERKKERMLMTDMVFLQPAESKLRNVKVSASMRIVKWRCNFARMRFQDATLIEVVETLESN